MSTFDILLTLTLGVVVAVGIFLILKVWKNSALQRRRIFRAQKQIKQLRLDQRKKVTKGTYSMRV